MHDLFFHKESVVLLVWRKGSFTLSLGLLCGKGIRDEVVEGAAETRSVYQLK